MFSNYLKIAIRNLVNNKGYSAINIVGLAAGIACCIFIMLYVQHELSYDRYHPDAESIFRVVTSKKTESRHTVFAGSSSLVAPTLKETFPQVKLAARVATSRSYSVSYNKNRFFEDHLNRVDAEVLNIFDIPFLRGDPETALVRPWTVIITEQIARKYFGEEDPLGKILTIASYDGENEYEVTGIIKNPPSNTHWHYGILQSWESVSEELRAMLPDSWDGGIFPTYVKLAPGTDSREFEQQICRLPHQYIGEQLEEQRSEIELFLQPVSAIHLHSNLTWEMEPPGNSQYIYIFSLVGILILLIASMNFMNLSTARSMNRAEEVGVRKVVGAQRIQLMTQFLGESMLITLIACILALVIVDLMMPVFNSLTEFNLTISHILQPSIFFGLLGIVFLNGFAAGMYPAIFMSSFRPLSILKGKSGSGTEGTMLRKFLVVGQYVISIALIAATIIIMQQLHFMKNASLGFDKEQKLIVGLELGSVDSDNLDAVKSEFKQHHSILGATVSSSVPGRWNYLWRVYPAGEENSNNHAMNFFQVDCDFLPEYGIKMAAGRPFNPELSADSSGGIICNAAAVRTFGWGAPENGIGKHLWNENNTIIGVMEDFHFRGLQEVVEPLIIFIMNDDYKYLSLTLDTENIEEAMAFVQAKYREMFPDKILDFFFLDEDFNRQYLVEEKVARIFKIFTLLGTAIACLGLLGLIAFAAEQRTKEIGIRKVLGATVAGIVTHLSRDFLVLVGLSAVIACPLAYYAMNKWLQSFAYRIEVNLWIFVTAGLVALLIAMATVSFQAVKAALADPIKSIRYE